MAARAVGGQRVAHFVQEPALPDRRRVRAELGLGSLIGLPTITGWFALRKLRPTTDLAVRLFS